MQAPLARRLALATMVVVTAWSLLAWAGRKEPGVAVAAPASAERRTAAEGSEEPVEGEGPAAINWADFGGKTPPFIATLANFGILVAGYYLLGRKPILAGLQSRRESIAKEIEEAQRMRQEAEERAKTYQAKLAKLQDEVLAAREALLRAGEAENDRIVKEAEAKAARMRKDAEFLVEQELKQIRQDLWRGAVDAAVTAAEEVLKRGVTTADQERLAEEFLTDLGKPAARSET
jgi:F-type H+-transporting ATPase subunit b